MEKFTGDIVAALQKHKKACGVSNMRQNYKESCRHSETFTSNLRVVFTLYKKSLH